MTIGRHIRRWIRRAPFIGMLRARRALRVPHRLMLETEATLILLIRLGLLQEYEFVRTDIILRWAFHPVNIIRPANLADQTILRHTGKIEQNWQWAIRKLMRTARVCDKRAFYVLATNYRFPLDHKF